MHGIFTVQNWSFYELGAPRSWRKKSSTEIPLASSITGIKYCPPVKQLFEVGLCRSQCIEF